MGFMALSAGAWHMRRGLRRLSNDPTCFASVPDRVHWVWRAWVCPGCMLWRIGPAPAASCDNGASIVAWSARLAGSIRAIAAGDRRSGLAAAAQGLRKYFRSLNIIRYYGVARRLSGATTGWAADAMPATAAARRRDGVGGRYASQRERLGFRQARAQARAALIVTLPVM